MEMEENNIESLIEGIEEYGKTNIELLKLKNVDKISDIGSSVLSRVWLFAILFLMIISFNICVSLWLGEVLGKSYYGFLMVTVFYFLLGIIFITLNSSFKKSLKNKIINQILN